jgi:hypothetical protein
MIIKLERIEVPSRRDIEMPDVTGAWALPRAIT